ncbi:MAG: DUF2946 family protein [Bdellovibrionales bacterium]
MRAMLLNRSFIAFLGFVLLMKLLVPAGFMPDMAALSQGSFKITICSASGARQIFVDETGKEAGQKSHHERTGKTGHDVCSFGASPQAALAPVLSVFASFLTLALAYPAAEDRQADITPLRAAWPRGPPNL